MERDINSPASLDFQLQQHMQVEWFSQNADGIEAYNRDVEEHGSFGDTLRSF